MEGFWITFTDRIDMLVDHEDVRAALTAALNPGSLGGGHG